MIRMTVESHEGAVSRRVQTTVPSIERAPKAAINGVTGRRVRPGWRHDIVAAGPAVSWGCVDARMDSDVMPLVEDRTPYLEDDAWVHEMGWVGLVWTRWRGTVTERRFALPFGLEVEPGVASPSLAATDPVDGGARRVVADGLSVIYDPKGVLASLLDACGRSGTTAGSGGLRAGRA